MTEAVQRFANQATQPVSHLTPAETDIMQGQAKDDAFPGDVLLPKQEGASGKDVAKTASSSVSHIIADMKYRNEHPRCQGHEMPMKKIRYPDNQCQITRRQPVINRSRCSYSPFKERTKIEFALRLAEASHKTDLISGSRRPTKFQTHRNEPQTQRVSQESRRINRTMASHNSINAERPQPPPPHDSSKLKSASATAFQVAIPLANRGKPRPVSKNRRCVVARRQISKDKATGNAAGAGKRSIQTRHHFRGAQADTSVTRVRQTRPRKRLEDLSSSPTIRLPEQPTANSGKAHDNRRCDL